MASKVILITGATGKQGGAVLKNLSKHPQFTLLAVTRNAESASAQKLTSRYPGTILVSGNLDDVPTIFKNAKEALRNAGKPEKIWGVYSVQVSLGPGVTIAGEIVQGKSLIDESIKEGVSHFVYSSVDRGGNAKSFDNPTPIPHFESKHQIEHHLLEKAGKNGEKMGWTILRPVAFMENIVPGMQSKVFLAALRDTMKGDPVQFVSVDDIGLFVTKAFLNPEQWNGRAEGLAGDELTFEEMDGCFQRATGKPTPVTFSILGSALKWGVKEVKVMLDWFKSDGYGVDIAKLRQEEKDLCDFERYLKERSDFVVQK